MVPNVGTETFTGPHTNAAFLGTVNSSVVVGAIVDMSGHKEPRLLLFLFPLFFVKDLLDLLGSYCTV